MSKLGQKKGLGITKPLFLNQPYCIIIFCLSSIYCIEKLFEVFLCDMPFCSYFDTLKPSFIKPVSKRPFIDTKGFIQVPNRI